jgi:hypothetical protein
MSGGIEVKKLLMVLLLAIVVVGSLVAIKNINDIDTETVSTKTETEEVSYMGDPNVQLHYFRDDHYPTAEEAATWHIHKGQFPLENKEGKVPLHNFNEN